MMIARRVCVSLFALCFLCAISCSHKVELFCDENTPCEDPERPFCDLDGEFEASEGIGNTCIPDPFAGVDAGPGADANPADAGAPPLPIRQIAVGSGHTCALLETGALRCWGDNRFGQLGYGNTDQIGDDEHPFTAGDVPIVGAIQAVAMGLSHTCVLLDSGGVRCFDFALSGQLGYGNTDKIGDDETPTMDVDLGGVAVQLAAGTSHTCALLQGGSVRCWGDAQFGQLGYGNQTDIGDDELPSSAGPVSLGGTAIQVVVGGDSTCALLQGGTVRCWGDNALGQLGLGNTSNIGDNELPSSQPAVDLGGSAVSLHAGGDQVCAVLTSGAIRCWGNNLGGWLGYGDGVLNQNVGDDEVPSVKPAIQIGGELAALSRAGYWSCARLTTGDVRCWGQNGSGQLGQGSTATIGDDELPSSAALLPLGGSVALLPEHSSNSSHVCVVRVDGGVRCWGLNARGQLGYGHTNDIGDNETIPDVDVQVLDPQN